MKRLLDSMKVGCLYGFKWGLIYSLLATLYFVWPIFEPSGTVRSLAELIGFDILFIFIRVGLPLTIICSLTSLLFTLLLSLKLPFGRGTFAVTCLAAAIFISISITSKMRIIDPDPEQRALETYIFIVFPTLLYIVWSFSMSNYIYKNLNVRYEPPPAS